MNALGGVGVVGAAGRVDVVVAAVPAVIHRVDPAFELDGELRVPFSGTVICLADELVFRPPAIIHGQFARRQQHRAAVGPVDLLLEEEIRGQPLGLRRIDVAGLVLEGEAADRRFAVEVMRRAA